MIWVKWKRSPILSFTYDWYCVVVLRDPPDWDILVITLSIALLYG